MNGYIAHLDQWIGALGILAYLILFGIKSLTRLRFFTNDSMNYVDIARNILAGRGIVQSTLGFNEPDFSIDVSGYSPVTAQPPGYPLLIAFFSKLGLSPTNAALLIPVISYGLILSATYLLTRTFYDDRFAPAAAVCLLLFYPLRKICSYAWSEAASIAFLTISFWLCAYIGTGPESTPWLLLVAGVAIGLAFAIRYALLPAFFLGILFFVVPADWAQTVYRLCFYVSGFLLPACLVLSFNLHSSKTLSGQKRLSSTLTLRENIHATLRTILGCYLSEGFSELQIVAIQFILLALSLALLFQNRLLASVETTLFGGKRAFLILWLIGYLMFLVYQRTRYHLNRISVRLTAPASILVVPSCIAILMSAFVLDAHVYALLIITVILAALVREIRDIVSRPIVNEDSRINSSERLQWIAQHVSADDLVIGDDTVDVPFYLGRPGVISFSPYPFTNRPDYHKIVAYCQAHSDKYKRFILILRKRFYTEEAWQYYYGSFISGIINGHVDNYSHIRFLCQLEDGYVFELFI